MSDSPELLEDLRAIDAAVEVTCASCGWSEVRDLEELLEQLRTAGIYATWYLTAGALRCGNPDCLLDCVRLRALPNTKVAPRGRRFEASLLSLALEILDPYGRTSGGARPSGTREVRLALRVVMTFVGNSHAFADYWERASASEELVHQDCHHPYGALLTLLAKAGWDVDCGGARWRGRP